MDLKRNIKHLQLFRFFKSASAFMLVAFMGFALLASPVQAGLDEMRSGLKTAAGDLQTDQGVPEIVGNIINAALSLIGVLLLVYLIYAGFLWMTAGGDTEKVKKATAMIRNSIVGILIITLSFVLANAVLDALMQGLGAGGTTPL